MKSSGIIYYHDWDYKPSSARIRQARRVVRIPTKSIQRTASLPQILGVGLIALALGGLIGPLTPFIRLEAGYRLSQARVMATIAIKQAGSSAFSALKTASEDSKLVAPTLSALTRTIAERLKPKPQPVASNAKTVLFTPLTSPDGSPITPVDTNFGLVVPKIGINAKVIPAVDPTNPGEYEKALIEGVAHASTSYFPDQNGTVYLFSHSTSYDWFVKDLNAVFYLVKNLDTGDLIVILYKGHEYTYKITEKKVVSPEAVAYLEPHAGARTLILQTCWPPGSTTERLLIFADLISDGNQSI